MEFAVVDFTPYAPSNNEPSAFAGSPITDPNGQLIGVIAFQMPLDQINKIMMDRTGLGKTGETYLVGPDKLMRSDSFLDSQNRTVKASFANPDKGRVDTDAAREALADGSSEQAASIEETSASLEEMSSMTKQNADNAEESASASEEMNAQAEEMKSYVSELVAMVGGKTGQTGTTHAPSMRRKAKTTTAGKVKALAAPRKKQAVKKDANPEEVFPLNDKDFEDF